MKIANIEVQNLHIILRLMILWYYYCDTIKSHTKKQGFNLSLENTILQKLQRESNWPPSLFRFKNSSFHETPWLLLLLKVKNEDRRTTSLVFYEIYEILYKLF